MKRLLLILTFVMTAPTAWAQCVGVNGINTIMNCPTAQNPQGTDYVLSYQTMQSPNNTRKMTLNQLAAFFGGGAFLPLTGGTLTGPLVLPNDPTQALQAATKQYVDAAVSPTTFNTKFLAWMATLPTALPSSPGVSWNDGGIPAVSQP